MKPKIQEVIVVEGRYDKNTVLQVVDATVIELGGFHAFHDRERVALLRRLARERGIILFTDPDGAGFVLRNYLKGAIGEGRVLQAYAPDIFGKERRKKVGGKEGKLGVEGMKSETILRALHRAGATFDGESAPNRGQSITKSDLMELGLVGDGSSARRAALLKNLALPAHLSTNALLETVNLLYEKEAFFALVQAADFP